MKDYESNAADTAAVLLLLAVLALILAACQPSAQSTPQGGDASSACGFDAHTYADARRHSDAVAGADAYGHAGATGASLIETWRSH